MISVRSPLRSMRIPSTPSSDSSPDPDALTDLEERTNLIGQAAGQKGSYCVDLAVRDGYSFPAYSHKSQYTGDTHYFRP